MGVFRSSYPRGPGCLMIDTSGLIKRDEAGLPPGWVQTTLAEVVEPRTGKADPQATPETRYIGMAHVEAHRMRLLGVETAGSMKSAASVFREGDVLYGRLRPYLNKVPDYVRTSSRSGGLAKVEVFLGSRASLPADGARSAALASLPRAGSPRSQEAGPLPRKAAGPG